MIVGWLIFALLCVSFWGLWGFVGKLTMNRGMNYLTFGGISSIGMAAIALMLLLFVGKLHLGAGRSIPIALLSGLLEGLGIIAFLGALERGPAAIVVPLIALYPAVTLVLSVTFLHEHLSLIQTFGIALTLVAAVLLADDASSRTAADAESSSDQSAGLPVSEGAGAKPPQ